MGFILPSKTNHPKDEEDGLKVATLAGPPGTSVLAIEAIVEGFKSTNPEALAHKYHRGNLTSEIRAVILHTKAATENKLVIGTGNKDEDYGVAYYTLFGDGAVHLSPIGNLPKRLVREMAAYRDLMIWRTDLHSGLGATKPHSKTWAAITNLPSSFSTPLDQGIPGGRAF